MTTANSQSVCRNPEIPQTAVGRASNANSGEPLTVNGKPVARTAILTAANGVLECGGRVIALCMGTHAVQNAERIAKAYNAGRAIIQEQGDGK